VKSACALCDLDVECALERNVLPDMTWEPVAKVMSVMRICFVGRALIFGGASLYFGLRQLPNIHLAWLFGAMATPPIFIWRTTLNTLRRIKARIPSS
jgi:hypothetical protein